VTNIRIKDEIEYLQTKKQKLNTQIYNLHLTLANNWGNSWQHIYHTIEDKLQTEIRDRYHTLDDKLRRLTQSQTATPRQERDFYPRVINNTHKIHRPRDVTTRERPEIQSAL